MGNAAIYAYGIALVFAITASAVARWWWERGNAPPVLPPDHAKAELDAAHREIETALSPAPPPDPEPSTALVIPDPPEAVFQPMPRPEPPVNWIAGRIFPAPDDGGWIPINGGDYVRNVRHGYRVTLGPANLWVDGITVRCDASETGSFFSAVTALVYARTLAQLPKIPEGGITSV